MSTYSQNSNMDLPCFASLQTAEHLQALDSEFQAFLTLHDTTLANQLPHYRAHTLSAAEESVWMIATAPILEKFIAHLFQIETDVQKLFDDTLACNLAFADKKKTPAYIIPLIKKSSQT